MTHPIELHTKTALCGLRNAEFDRPAESDSKISPGTYFSWDTEGGDVAIVLKNAPETLLSADITVRRNPSWFSFNLALGDAALEAGDVLGIVAEVTGYDNIDMAFFVRSARDGGHADTRLQDQLVGSAARIVRTVLHTIEPDDALAWGMGYHTLLLDLPRKTGSLALHDLRIFLLPAACGLRSTPQIMASYAT